MIGENHPIWVENAEITRHCCQRPKFFMTINDDFKDPQLSKEIEYLTRRKIVRQLHDGLTQTVSALAMRINFARRLMETDPDAAGIELEKVEDLTREATKEIRHIIFLLRPDDQESFDLFSALEQLAEKMLVLFEIEITLNINEVQVGEIPEYVQRVVYATVEDAIDSARIRNRTKNYSVRLRQLEGQLVQLLIEDTSEGVAQELPFQGVEQENIQRYANLIRGSVSLEKDGMLMQILFPLKHSIDEGD